jgi:hypothetical protein
MDCNIQDSFVVYLRIDPLHAASPDEIEQPIAYCGTYAEALRVGRACLRNAQQSIIRFQGDVGGGD